MRKTKLPPLWALCSALLLSFTDSLCAYLRFIVALTCCFVRCRKRKYSVILTSYDVKFFGFVFFHTNPTYWKTIMMLKATQWVFQIIIKITLNIALLQTAIVHSLFWLCDRAIRQKTVCYWFQITASKLKDTTPDEQITGGAHPGHRWE